MRFTITGCWKDGFEHDGMLYLAQRIEEMLMAFTSHLYKVPVYNSYLLAYEYLATYPLAINNTINQAHLKIIVEEFVDIFSSDIVIKKHLTEAEINYFCGKVKSDSIQEQVKWMHYLFHKLSDYDKWCSETIIESTSQPREKKKIERSLRSFLPMIIGSGYSPEYISRFCKEVFLHNEVKDITRLETFIERFNGKGETYDVFFAVKNMVRKFRNILESRLDILFENGERINEYKYDRKKYICLHMTLTDRDPHSAAEQAYHRFNLFMQYYRFLGNRDEELCMDKAMVIDAEGKQYFPHMRPARYRYSKDYDDVTLGKHSERIITNLIENGGISDFERIERIIKTHNTALNCQDSANAFLNLWSIFEMIGINEEHSESKIQSIMKAIIPILLRNYVKDIVAELHDYLKGNLSSEDYTNLMSLINVKESDEYKICCIIALKEKKDVRQEACKLLKKYPLIRSRVSQLYEDVFKTKKKYLAEIHRFSQRLTWHIQRLYRARNSIIHSGESPSNIKDLVEHLHSYVDEIILDIIERMTNEKPMGSIENAILDAQVYMEGINRDFTKDEEFKEDDIARLL